MTKLSLCIAIFTCVTATKLSAATSERLLTFTLSGYFQDFNPRTGDDVAVPFRITTRDILEEISLSTGTNVMGGVLVVVDSLDDTNALTQIYARPSLNQIVGEINVTDLFDIQQSGDVRSTRFSRNVFKSATFYAIDSFLFSTIVDDVGLELLFQGLSRETQAASTRTIGGFRRSVVSANMKSDGNGELFSGNGFIGPIKGSIKIGPPKFYP